MKSTSAVSRGLLALFGGLGAYLLWTSLPWPLIHDAPILHYIAWRIGQGAVPYRDLFDMNQPGVYLIHMGVLKILGDGDRAWRLFDVASLAVAAAVLAWLAAPWGRIAAVGGSLCFALYHLADGAWQAGQRDFLICPFLLAAAVGLARWLEAGGKGARASLGASGLTLGAAMTIKPHVALLAVGFSVVVVAVAWRAPVNALAIYLSMLALAPVTMLVWLARLGALGAWRDVVVDYLVPLYARLGQPAHWAFHRWHVWIAIAAAVGLSLASTLWHGRFTARHGVATLGLGYGLAHFFGQGKGWEYHLYPLAAFAAVLAFSEVDAVLRARRLVPAVSLLAALVAVAGLLGQKGAEAADAGWIRDKERLVRLLVSDLGAHIRPGDTVQVLDTTGGGIHALLRLHTGEPTRFLYDFHFFHDTDRPVIRQLRAEFVRDLAAHPPRFVVVFERGWPAGRYERVETFSELARWLRDSYTIRERRDGYVIFANRRSS